MSELKHQTCNQEVMALILSCCTTT